MSIFGLTIYICRQPKLDFFSYKEIDSLDEGDNYIFPKRLLSLTHRELKMDRINGDNLMEHTHWLIWS